MRLICDECGAALRIVRHARGITDTFTRVAPCEECMREAERDGQERTKDTAMWKKVADELPPLDAPVFLRLADGRCLPGVREHMPCCGGWVWSRLWTVPWWSEKGQRWEPEDAEYDDEYEVTHWHPFPDPPPIT